MLLENKIADRTEQVIVNYTGLLATYAFGFFAWLSTAGANIALAVLFFAFILCRPVWPVCRRDPLIWLFIAFAAYLLLSTTLAITEFPETRQLQIKDASRWLKLFAFWPVAWWLKGDLKRINLLLILAVGGLMLGILGHLDWWKLARFDASFRTGFRFGAIFGGLVSSAVMLGLLLFAPRIWQSRYPWLAGFLWVTAFYLSTYMLLSSQSRGAWLATLATTPLMVGTYYVSICRTTKSSFTHWWSFIILTFGLLVTIFAINSETILSRINSEHETVTKLIAGKTQDLPQGSLTHRYNAQTFGLKKWLEKPLLGWGPGTTQYLIHQSHDILLMEGQSWLAHLHNTYLEVLVRLGLVGASLLFLCAFQILYILLKARQSNALPLDYFLFMVGSFSLVAIWNLFDFRALRMDWQVYWIILASIAYSSRFTYLSALQKIE